MAGAQAARRQAWEERLRALFPYAPDRANPGPSVLLLLELQACTSSQEIPAAAVHAVLLDLLAELPVDWRVVLELRYGYRDGVLCSQREIARRMGGSVAAGHQRLHRALAAVRAHRLWPVVERLRDER